MSKLTADFVAKYVQGATPANPVLQVLDVTPDGKDYYQGGVSDGTHWITGM
jgi:hypothetical protein